MTDHARLSAGSAVLTEIVDFFATKQEGLGDMWAHPDDFSSYGLDYRHRDGTQLWIDLEKDGVVHILWKPAGQEKPTTVNFGLIPNPAQPTGLTALVLEYARDLRRNSSGGDDYPWEYAKGTADYLEELVRRSAAQPPAAPVETGRNRDPIHAPDGRTWYQTALDEASKRGANELRIHELEEQLAAHPGSSAGSGGARAALDKLADKVSAKINQLQYYCDNDCQLDHAKTIAEGRLQQANQILHWIAEAAVSHTTEPQGARESREEYERGYADGIEWAITQGPQTPLKGDGQ